MVREVPGAVFGGRIADIGWGIVWKAGRFRQKAREPGDVAAGTDSCGLTIADLAFLASFTSQLTREAIMSASKIWRAVLLSISISVVGCGMRKERADSRVQEAPLPNPDTRAQRGKAAIEPPQAVQLAAANQEFRAIFVANAYNLDWPYKPNIHHTEMRRQMEVIIARAKELKANVILLQVRAFGDRIYRDTDVTPKLPWAVSLNGGKDPDEASV